MQNGWVLVPDNMNRSVRIRRHEKRFRSSVLCGVRYGRMEGYRFAPATSGKHRINKVIVRPGVRYQVGNVVLFEAVAPDYIDAPLTVGSNLAPAHVEVGL